MTLRMADGPVANLPAGLDAYAGYVDHSGIGVTWPEVEQIPAPHHLSIAAHGAPAMCADVEPGAMTSWAGYDVGYCSVSNVNDLIAAYGRPKKLWTAHDDPSIGAHLCSPACWPGLVTTADGTQWGFHGSWDESWLLDDFFDLTPAPPPPDKGMTMLLDPPVLTLPDGTDVVVQVGADGTTLWGKSRPPTKQWNENTNAPLGQIVKGSVPGWRLMGGQVQVFCEEPVGDDVVIHATNDGATWGQQAMG
jgi:hypothetical protein